MEVAENVAEIVSHPLFVMLQLQLQVLGAVCFHSTAINARGVLLVQTIALSTETRVSVALSRMNMLKRRIFIVDEADANNLLISSTTSTGLDYKIAT